MKKIILLLFLNLFVLCSGAQNALTFTIFPLSPSNSITCKQAQVRFTAITDATNAVTFFWQGNQTSYTGGSVNITVPDTYTVSAISQNNQTSSQLVQVGINTTAPSSSLFPNTATISCNNYTAQINASGNLTTNCSHFFISPAGGTLASTGTTSSSFTPSMPGIYTHELINTLNGCKATKTFTVNSVGSFPSFQLTSSSNFSLGCGSKSITPILIANASTSPPGGAVSFSLFSGQSSGSLSPITNYSLNIPGIYTIIVRDNTSLCDSKIPFSIFDNTQLPALITVVPNQTLSCNLKQTKMHAISPETTDFLWHVGTNPYTLNGSSLTVLSNSALAQSSLVSTFTITATNWNSQCITATVVPVYQNLFKPITKIANSTSNHLTCNTSSIVLTNQSVSGIPLGSAFPNNLSVIAHKWLAPPPQAAAQYTTNYVVSNAGIYTLQVIDLNNGCEGFDTMAVFNKKIYPLVNYPSGPYPFCINPSSPSVAVFPIISNNSSDYIYNWTGPPASSLSNYNTPTITVTGIGIYTVVVTNTLNGCSTKGQIIVANCYTGLNEFGYNSAAFSVYPNPIENKFTLEYNQNETAELEIQIHTISGELIHKEKMREQKIQVNSETYCSGIYFLHVKKNGSIIYTTKLIRK